MDLLLNKGAFDVFFTPINMKKNRPATMLSVICNEDLVCVMEEIIFLNLSTIGLRKYNCSRSILKRENIIFNTSYGNCRFKISYFENNKYIYPEYDDVKNIALENNLGFNELYADLKYQGCKLIDF